MNDSLPDEARHHMSTQGLKHIPVMLKEALDGLGIRPDGCYLDGTFGRGGHAREVLQRLGPQGRLLLMDQDPTAVAVAQQEFGGDARIAIRYGSFAELGNWSETEAGLDGVLLDLGVSSPQLDETARGFSFQADAPLDMRMNPLAGESAAQWLVRSSEREIAEVLWGYGEERFGRPIARAIVEQRAEMAIETTTQLAELVARVVKKREPGRHPATRTFQALRIQVNAELQALEHGLIGALARLNTGGRLAVISFHSLEDRIVKRFMREQSQAPMTRRGLPPPPEAALKLKLIGGAQFPGDAEVATNPRSRSAVLRVAERLA